MTPSKLEWLEMIHTDPANNAYDDFVGENAILPAAIGIVTTVLEESSTRNFYASCFQMMRSH
jgi:hypothetical protein